MINSLPKKSYIALFITLAIFITASACMIILAYYIYQNQKKDINNAAQQQLTAIAELKVWEINNWRSERIGDANVIYKNNLFTSNVLRYFNNPLSLEAKNNILSLLSATQKSYQYKNILLLDKDKQVRLALDEYDSDFGMLHSDVINETITKNNIIFSDFHRNDKTNIIYLSIAIPTPRYGNNYSRSQYTFIPSD